MKENTSTCVRCRAESPHTTLLWLSLWQADLMRSGIPFHSAHYSIKKEGHFVPHNRPFHLVRLCPSWWEDFVKSLTRWFISEEKV